MIGDDDRWFFFPVKCRDVVILNWFEFWAEGANFELYTPKLAIYQVELGLLIEGKTLLVGGGDLYILADRAKVLSVTTIFFKF